MKTALVITGDGIGDAIQSTPTITAHVKSGFRVDVYMPDAAPDWVKVFEEPAGVAHRAHWNHRHLRRSYDVITSNWLLGARPLRTTGASNVS